MIVTLVQCLKGVAITLSIRRTTTQRPR